MDGTLTPRNWTSKIESVTHGKDKTRFVYPGGVVQSLPCQVQDTSSDEDSPVRGSGRADSATVIAASSRAAALAKGVNTDAKQRYTLPPPAKRHVKREPMREGNLNAAVSGGFVPVSKLETPAKRANEVSDDDYQAAVGLLSLSAKK